jgi:hypothetical protein
MLIGITGRRRSGKTTLADLLCSAHGLHHDSFAAPMREFVASILGMSLAELEAAKESPVDWLNDVTPRHMLQTLGTEWGRQMVDSELWIKAAVRRAANHPNVVLSDVRFPNEAKLIRQAGGIILRTHRPSELSSGAHASEVPIPGDMVDLEVYNDGRPEDMLTQAERFLFGSGENPATDPDVLAYCAPGCPAAAMAGD